MDLGLPSLELSQSSNHGALYPIKTNALTIGQPGLQETVVRMETSEYQTFMKLILH
jgi:hypothetical protein